MFHSSPLQRSTLPRDLARSHVHRASGTLIFARSPGKSGPTSASSLDAVLILAFDTSSPAVTVALARADVPADDEVSLGGRFRLTQRGAHGSGCTTIAQNRHGELLSPMIEELLDEQGVQPSELDAVAVGLGPGPFTGLRVGIVTAKAMSDALGIPAYGVCSLDVIAKGCSHGRNDFAVVTDARRKQVYWQAYEANALPVGDPELSFPDAVAQELRGRIDFVAGAGAVMYSDAFAGFTILTDLHRPGPAMYPVAFTLATIVIEQVGAGTPSDDLTPLYLRRPDARPPGKPKAVTPA
jgi:tRNA threonylcarbamoyl adenosine modification protein YeaZ